MKLARSLNRSCKFFELHLEASKHIKAFLVVVVAQLVELRIVIPAVAGSNPVDHPNFLFKIKPYKFKNQNELDLHH
jgi:hypothetical protein